MNELTELIDIFEQNMIPMFKSSKMQFRIPEAEKNMS